MNGTIDFPQIETDRLLLRQLTHDDVDVIFPHFSDDEILQYIDSHPAKGVEDVAAIIDWGLGLFNKKSGILWGIFSREGDSFMGQINYVLRVDSNLEGFMHRVEIGYELGKKYWGKGYMSEVFRSIIPYIFSNKNINRIEATIHPQNTRSRKIVERFGFQEEGILREVAVKDGEYWDMVQYSLLKREWNTVA